MILSRNELYGGMVAQIGGHFVSLQGGSERGAPNLHSISLEKKMLLGQAKHTQVIQSEKFLFLLQGRKR